jgi:hypothetical protein
MIRNDIRAGHRIGLRPSGASIRIMVVVSKLFLFSFWKMVVFFLGGDFKIIPIFFFDDLVSSSIFGFFCKFGFF